MDPSDTVLTCGAFGLIAKMFCIVRLRCLGFARLIQTLKCVPCDPRRPRDLSS